MKLRNKKTGEIVEAESCNSVTGMIGIYYEEFDGQVGTKDCFESLAELNEEWEDYEEPKEYWYIDSDGNVCNCTKNDVFDGPAKEIGNYFETREEAEKALEKLKAWQRLRDKGFRIEGWTIDDGLRITICTNTDSDGIYDDDKKEMKKDLDLLFEGEE